MTNRQIAQRQRVSLDAVKFHVGNALGKLGFASRVQLRLWHGVERGSALGVRGAVPSGPVALGDIAQIARSVRDVQAAEAWYRDVLGLQHLYTFGDLVFFDCGGTRLFLSSVLPSTLPQADSVLYFRVADIHAASADLRSRGVTFTSAPHLIHRHDDGTEEWLAFFLDNEARTLALLAQVTSARDVAHAHE